jgi:hypothetical protein
LQNLAFKIEFLKARLGSYTLFQGALPTASQPLFNGTELPSAENSESLNDE